MFFRRNRDDAGERLRLALAEMDNFFAENPWGAFSVDPDLAEAMGAFAEEAGSPDDFGFFPETDPEGISRRRR
ncbi:MAG: hypothetical protein LBW85_02570 [Deltaproteobacteria bacterium]|jgi:hypothetical protein|nr:hypothetical protein [Deltaproteobacteria bacterium]